MTSQTFLPYDMSRGEAPEEWRRQDVAFVRFTHFSCARIAWGPYERHVDILFESHGRRVPPDSCFQGDFTYWDIISTVLVSHADVAAYLNATYGLPTGFATLSLQANATSEIMLPESSWEVNGSRSYIRTAQEANPATDDESIFRSFWVSHDRLYYMDATVTAKLDPFRAIVGHGEIRPPMVYAQAGNNLFAGMASYGAEVSAQVEIKAFEDLSCEVPASL